MTKRIYTVTEWSEGGDEYHFDDVYKSPKSAMKAIRDQAEAHYSSDDEIEEPFEECFIAEDDGAVLMSGDVRVWEWAITERQVV